MINTTASNVGNQIKLYIIKRENLEPLERKTSSDFISDELKKIFTINSYVLSNHPSLWKDKEQKVKIKSPLPRLPITTGKTTQISKNGQFIIVTIHSMKLWNINFIFHERCWLIFTSFKFFSYHDLTSFSFPTKILPIALLYVLEEC